MHVLIIGGTRFVGYLLTFRLLAGRHRVTLFHRGTTRDPFGARVEHVLGDRTTDDFERLLAGRTFDAVVDFAAFTGDDVTRAVQTLAGATGHYVFISTGQVYLVRGRGFASPERPAKETDYDGPVMPRPSGSSGTESEIASWDYGVGKRAGEDALVRAFAERKFPATSIRIPMVNGPRDYYRRIDEYVLRLLDGGPILLPDGGDRPTRHVHADDVARAIAALLGEKKTFGEAYNLAQEETPTLRELVTMLAGQLGATPTFVSARSEEIQASLGVEPRDFSPFSARWMSFLDPSKAKAQLGFRATPVPVALSQVVAAYLAQPPLDDPEGYVHRDAERAFAERRLRKGKSP